MHSKLLFYVYQEWISMATIRFKILSEIKLQNKTILQQFEDCKQKIQQKN